MSSSSSSSREPSRGFAFPLFFFFFFSSFSASSHDRICLSSGVVWYRAKTTRVVFVRGERTGRGVERNGTSEEGRKGGVGSFFNRVLRVCWTIFGVHGVHANTYVLYRWSVHGWGTPFFSSLFELFYLFLLLPFVSLPFFFFGSFETLLNYVLLKP